MPWIDGFPRWMQNIKATSEQGTLVRVVCTSCPATKDLRSAAFRAMIASVGPDYCLINRRCRCKLTPLCPGWNRFTYDGHGGMTRLWTDEQERYWQHKDKLHRQWMAEMIKEGVRDAEEMKRRRRR